MFDLSLSHRVLFALALCGCAAEVSGTRQSPLDAGAPPVDVPAPRDRAVSADAPVDVTRVDVVRPTAPLALTLTTNNLMPDGIGETTELFEDGQTWSEACGGLTGACEYLLGHLPDGPTGVASLRAAMEATGLLAVPESSNPPNADTARFILRYRNGGREVRWDINDPNAAPPPLRRSLELVQSALLRSVR